MKNKKFLLILPLFALLTGCSISNIFGDKDNTTDTGNNGDTTIPDTPKERETKSIFEEDANCMNF